MEGRSCRAKALRQTTRHSKGSVRCIAAAARGSTFLFRNNEIAPREARRGRRRAALPARGVLPDSKNCPVCTLSAPRRSRRGSRPRALCGCLASTLMRNKVLDSGSSVPPQKYVSCVAARYNESAVGDGGGDLRRVVRRRAPGVRVAACRSVYLPSKKSIGTRQCS